MTKDVIYRQAAIEALLTAGHINLSDGQAYFLEKALNEIPSARPDNQTNLCDSCDYLYHDCPSKKDDVIFGNGIGNDNICACNKYKPSAQPERKKGQWIYNESDDMFECSVCGGEMIRNVFTYCPWCGERMVRGDEMTSKEAAEYILDHFIGGDTKWDKAIFLAYCALQKQIPKKPLQACGHATEMFRESIPSMNYCPICGQRIDWKGEEDEAYRCGCNKT